MKRLVIIPAYNEEANLEDTVQSVLALDYPLDVVIINDGSADKTGAVAASLAARETVVHAVHLPYNCGIGVAIQTGLRFARDNDYDFAVQFDGDGQHDAGSLEALFEHAAANELDLCVGSRYLEPGDGNFRSTVMRRFGSRIIGATILMLTGIRPTDPTSGFRVYGRRTIRWFASWYPEDYPEPESVFWCARRDYRFAEIPVRMRDRQGGESSIATAHSVYYMVKVTLAIFIDRLRTMES